MQTSVTAKKVELTPAIKSYAEEKIEKLDKFMDGIMEAHILLRVEKHRHIAEVSLHAKHADFAGKEISEDLYAAIDRVSEKLERQLRKYKTRTLSRRRERVAVAEDFGDTGSITIFGGDGSYETEDRPIIKEKIIHLDRLKVEEAISRMEVHGDDFWVYAESENGDLSVVYRRKDGSYGLIQARE